MQVFPNKNPLSNHRTTTYMPQLAHYDYMSLRTMLTDLGTKGEIFMSGSSDQCLKNNLNNPCPCLDPLLEHPLEDQLQQPQLLSSTTRH